MTDEMLETMLNDIAKTYPLAAIALERHVAALTAERDAQAARVAELEHANQKHAAIVRAERDALRERVQVLEADVAAWEKREGELLKRGTSLMVQRDTAQAAAFVSAVCSEDGTEAAGECHGVASRTTADCGTCYGDGMAPSQEEAPQCSLHPGRKCDPETPGVFECRAHETPGRLGGAAPINPDAASEADTPLPEGVLCGAHEIEELCGSCGNTGRMPAEAEPTTAEAFATVRRGLAANATSAANIIAGPAALSLLERRMGAMERALSAFLNRPTDAVTPDLEEMARAALTAAPPVFTLEEVEKALRAAYGPRAMTATVREALFAIRKVTP